MLFVLSPLQLNGWCDTIPPIPTCIHPICAYALIVCHMRKVKQPPPLQNDLRPAHCTSRLLFIILFTRALVLFAVIHNVTWNVTCLAPNCPLLLLIPSPLFFFGTRGNKALYILRVYLIQTSPNSINLPLTVSTPPQHHHHLPPSKTPSGERRPCQDCDCAPVLRTSCSQDRQALVN